MAARTNPRMLPWGLALVALGACGSDAPEPTAPPDWCSPAGYGVETTGELHLVSDRCTSTASLPVHPTVAIALNAASPGATILIDEGQHTESLTVAQSARLVGRGADLTRIVPPSGQPGLIVKGGAAVTAVDLGVEGATKAGVALSAGSLALERVTVRGTQATTGDDGHGVQVTDGGELTLGAGVQILDNEGVGVLVFEAAAVVDGTFVKGNGRGGIAVVDGTFQPTDTDKVVDGTFQPRISGSTLEGNQRFGVALYGSTLSIDTTTIRDTAALPTWTGGGDGVLLVPGAGPAKATLGPETVVRDSARAGMLLSGETVAVVDGTFLDNGRAGVWAQGAGASLTVRESALISANRYFGLAATDHAALTITGATIEQTEAAAWAPGEAEPVGDGVAVSDGAALTMSGARVVGSGRAGLLAKAPSGTTFVVDGTFFEGGEYAVVVDDAPADKAWTLPTLTEGAEGTGGEKNTWAGATKGALGQDLGLALPTTLCEGTPPAGATGCLPSP